MMENKRTEGLLGKEAVNKLEKQTVMVVGCGGVGSFCVEALARTGVGNLILIDADVFELSNLNRQLPATLETLGKYKVDVLKERIQTINPECCVKTYAFFYDSTKDEELFSASIDFVIDCIDCISRCRRNVQASCGTPSTNAHRYPDHNLECESLDTQMSHPGVSAIILEDQVLVWYKSKPHRHSEEHLALQKSGRVRAIFLPAHPCSSWFSPRRIRSVTFVHYGSMIHPWARICK